MNLVHDLGGRSPRARLAGCPRWLREACERLREPEHLAGGVQALARLAGRSPEHVARQLRACAGLRPVDLVTEARIDHAATRLALSEVAILEIALECGFDSLSHFYRCSGESGARRPAPFASAARPPSAERRGLICRRAARPPDASSVCGEVSL